MSNCAVATCKNYINATKGTDIRYFRFPRDPKLSKQWARACRRKDEINIKNSRVCSAHFAADCFEIPLKQRLLNYTRKNDSHLKINSVPTLHLPGTANKLLKRSSSSIERDRRMAKKKRQEEVQKILEASSPVCQLQKEEVIECTLKSNIITHGINPTEAVNTQLKQLSSTKLMENEIMQLKSKIKLLENENGELQRKCQQIEETTINHYEAILSRVFTQEQIQKLKNLGKNMKVYWSPGAIASAISLCRVSPKAFRYLKAHNI